MSVSYTHLAVYKRQVFVSGAAEGGLPSPGQARGVLLALGAALLYAAIVISNKKMKNISGLERTVVQLGISALVLPVSYTHLDVYKRQTWRHIWVRASSSSFSSMTSRPGVEPKQKRSDTTRAPQPSMSLVRLGSSISEQMCIRDRSPAVPGQIQSLPPLPPSAPGGTAAPQYSCGS